MKKMAHSEAHSHFKIFNDFKPAGDQPQAIEKLLAGYKKGYDFQTLLGVTGSGKTFTMANVIAKVGKPTLVIAHNKTLAAQLAQEYKEFFPEAAVHYFVSYYDYYQPEAYLPVTDTYIEKEAQINEEIDRLRHASTQALLTRRDVIVVATVSCIYGLGSPEEYKKVNILFQKNMPMTREELVRKLVDIHYQRTPADLSPGQFRALGNSVEIMPVNERIIYRIDFQDILENSRSVKGSQSAPIPRSVSVIESIIAIDPVTRRINNEVDSFFLFPAKHFITAEEEIDRAFNDIKTELDQRLKELLKAGKLLEAERLKRRTSYDLAMIREVGYCNGIENYSRHFSGKAPGEPPETLLSYFPHDASGRPDFLTVIDESHVTIPQLGGMFAGDASRKQNLVEHGFRLPSAKDNRPLNFSEFEKSIGQVIFTSATPSKYEKEKSKQTVEQIIRPTGLVDPKIEVKKIVEDKKDGKDKKSGKDRYKGQIFDFIEQTEIEVKKGGRVIATTLTKKMSEDLSEYLKDRKIKAEYLHSEIETLDRIRILTEFRRGKFDCLVGVNLLREGLDLPEVTFIGILDADKEGFLRSETSLIQTIGRAARNSEGRVILYAENITGSMKRAIDETNRRRTIQIEYNTKHGITPKTISKNIKDITEQIQTEHQKTIKDLLTIDEKDFKENPKRFLKRKAEEMESAVKVLDFETAAIIRDELKVFEERFAKIEKTRKKTLAEKKGYTELQDRYKDGI